MATEKIILGSAPLFAVKDLIRSVDYYCDVLGFERPHLWGDPPFFAMPHRDGFVVMLSQVQDASKVKPNHLVHGHWDAYFWVRNVRALFAEFKSRHARVVYEPTHKEQYGNLEFAITDPDDYLLAFAQEVTEDRFFD